MKITASLCLVALSVSPVAAFDMPQPTRRALLETLGTAAVAATTTLAPLDAWASGGATAGKYTTIPIAKRRYYGRVQQGVHDFVSA